MSANPARIGTALLLPPILWYLQQQGLGGPLRMNCRVVDGWPAVAWGLVSLFGCGVAAWLAAPIARQSPEGGTALQIWLARVALLGSGVGSVAITLGALASALVPACAR